MDKYFKKITFPDNIHIPDTPDCAIPPCDIDYSTAYNILVQIEKLTNKEICDKIIEFAKNNGVTDLYLLDEEFVTTALKNEAERRTQPKNHFNRIRNMSVEEMAGFFDRIVKDNCTTICSHLNKCLRNNATEPICKNHYKQWLLQEVSENE